MVLIIVSLPMQCLFRQTRLRQDKVCGPVTFSRVCGPNSIKAVARTHRLFFFFNAGLKPLNNRSLT